MQIKKIK